MISYEKFAGKPQIAKSMIDMSLAEFEALYAEFEIAHLKRQSALSYTRRHKAARRRSVGAGRKYKYALRDRLLMTLFWLRMHATYEVLGLLFGVDKTTVARDVKNVHESLAELSRFKSDVLQAEIPKLRSVQEVMDTFPDVRLFLDAGE